jgi:hypothetical protein
MSERPAPQRQRAGHTLAYVVAPVLLARLDLTVYGIRFWTACRESVVREIDGETCDLLGRLTFSRRGEVQVRPCRGLEPLAFGFLKAAAEHALFSSPTCAGHQGWARQDNTYRTWVYLPRDHSETEAKVIQTSLAP